MVEEELLPVAGWHDHQRLVNAQFPDEHPPPRCGLLPMMISHACHSSYNCLAVRLYMCKRRTSGKLVMKALRASYAAANGWPAAFRTIVELIPEAFCRARCRSGGRVDVMGVIRSWWCCQTQ